VNKAFEKYEKQMKAAKSSGNNTKAKQDKVLKQAERSQNKRGGKGKNEPIDDAGTSQSNAPQKWSDYSVQFHFPEPTELTPPLMQLIDADFKYPGELHCMMLVKHGGCLVVHGVWPVAAG
jgi:ATP-binding cassette subfamily F protein 1